MDKIIEYSPVESEGVIDWKPITAKIKRSLQILSFIELDPPPPNVRVSRFPGDQIILISYPYNVVCCVMKLCSVHNRNYYEARRTCNFQTDDRARKEALDEIYIRAVGIMKNIVAEGVN